MFRLTSKVKIAAGIAAGVVTLGAAGAYAANANNTITTYPLTSPALQHNGQTLNLASTDKNTTSLTLPSTPFKNQGQCVSWFATNKKIALAPASGSTVSKNYHGKLMSGIHSFCQTYATTNGTSAQTETPDATPSSTPETDSTDGQSGASHGHGHAYGHSKHASDTD